jgi:hypothetical protein
MEWKELDLNNPPEKAQQFCNKCCGKNRGEVGWRYRENAAMREHAEQCQRMLGTLGDWAADRNLAKLEYQCNFCREDKPKKVTKTKSQPMKKTNRKAK